MKVCQRVAPSISAASNISGGIAARPASRITNMNGVHCQTSAAMMAMKFQGVWVSQLIATGSEELAQR